MEIVINYLKWLLLSFMTSIVFFSYLVWGYLSLPFIFPFLSPSGSFAWRVSNISAQWRLQRPRWEGEGDLDASLWPCERINMIIIMIMCVSPILCSSSFLWCPHKPWSALRSSLCIMWFYGPCPAVPTSIQMMICVCVRLAQGIMFFMYIMF